MFVYVYMKLIQYNETRPIPLVNMARVSFNYHMFTKSKKYITGNSAEKPDKPSDSQAKTDPPHFFIFHQLWFLWLGLVYDTPILLF